ncbi:hypothetical protein Tco_1064386 [Tanacetum coccineum]
MEEQRGLVVQLDLEWRNDDVSTLLLSSVPKLYLCFKGRDGDYFSITDDGGIAHHGNEVLPKLKQHGVISSHQNEAVGPFAISLVEDVRSNEVS